MKSSEVPALCHSGGLTTEHCFLPSFLGDDVATPLFGVEAAHTGC